MDSGDAVEPNKPLKQGWLDDPLGVGLADSTPRPGEPVTWGSGEQSIESNKGNTGSIQRETTGSYSKKRNTQP